MNTDRINRLADWLDKREQVKYNQSVWMTDVTDADDHFTFNGRATPTDGSDAGIEGTIVYAKEGACGSAACAAGSAVFALPEAKMFLFTGHVYKSVVDGEEIHTAVGINIGVMNEKGEVLTDFAAASYVFDISIEDAEVIFGSPTTPETSWFYYEDPTERRTFNPRVVAARLRALASNPNLVNETAEKMRAYEARNNG